ncbi:MAG: hypothetical protein J6D37_04000 [Clostridia bacterium]|nr:hypothetical protein [Clostridia bacterium]
MTLEQVMHEVEKINAYVKKPLWLDFTFKEIYKIDEAKDFRIVLIGSEDLFWEGYESIEIIFKTPSYISAKLLDCFSPCEGKAFIEVVSDVKKSPLKDADFICEGYLFKFNMDCYDFSPIWIYAEEICCNILKEY